MLNPSLRTYLEDEQLHEEQWCASRNHGHATLRFFSLSAPEKAHPEHGLSTPVLSSILASLFNFVICTVKERAKHAPCNFLEFL